MRNDTTSERPFFALACETRVPGGAMTRAVYLTLAGHADSQGGCFPGVGRLADLNGIEPRSVTRILENDGLVSTHHVAGRASRYTVHVQPNDTPDPPVTPTPDPPVTPPLTDRSGEDPLKNKLKRSAPPCPPEPPRRRARASALVERFGREWYPAHRGGPYAPSITRKTRDYDAALDLCEHFPDDEIENIVLFFLGIKDGAATSEFHAGKTRTLVWCASLATRIARRLKLKGHRG